MTNHWIDIKNADVILTMGGNAAEAHPCGFKGVTEARAHSKGHCMVVDPRFNRLAAVADYHAPIRSGSDIGFLGGVIGYLLTNDRIHHEYVRAYTDFTILMREDFNFDEGYFLGYSEDQRPTKRAAGTPSSAMTVSSRPTRPYRTRAAHTSC